MNRQSDKSIVIAVGGTGGHLFPAMTVVDEIRSRNPECFTVFMGEGLETNPFFAGERFSYRQIASASPSFGKTFFRSAFRILLGVVQSFRALRKISPRFVVGFGSYHSFPVLVAARFLRIPIVLFEANAIPGKVNRIFSRYALFSTVQFCEAKKHLQGKSFTVSMPLRHRVIDSEEDPYAYFSLSRDRPVLLVFGGSQGARFLNEIFPKALDSLSKANDLQILHFTGKGDPDRDWAAFYAERNTSVCVKPFESRMDLAWQIADAVVCRAGASTVAEILHFSVPAFLIPYPHAADNHQWHNARFLEELGGGICAEETSDTVPVLRSFLEMCLEKQNETMKKRMQDRKKETSHDSLSDLLIKLLKNEKKVL